MSRSAADSPPGPRARRRPRSVANARDRFLEHYELLADAAVMVRATPPNEPSLMAQRDWTIVRGTSWRSPCQHYREDAAGTEGALCLGHAPQIRSVAHARCHRRVRTERSWCNAGGSGRPEREGQAPRFGFAGLVSKRGTVAEDNDCGVLP
jgi:hypothetical protein